MEGAASLRSCWISTENGNPSDAKPQKPTRLKRLDGWTVRLRKVSIRIYHLLWSHSSQTKSLEIIIPGCAKRKEMGTTAIESFPSVELINEVVQRFKMTCRFFLSVFMFSYCVFLSSTSLVLRGKHFLGFWLYESSLCHWTSAEASKNLAAEAWDARGWGALR